MKKTMKFLFFPTIFFFVLLFGETGEAAAIRWATVNARVLLLLHPDMASFDCLQGLFFRNNSPENQTVQEQLQSAWNRALPAFGAIEDARRKVFYERMALMRKRETSLQELQKYFEGNPGKIAERQKRHDAIETQFAQANVQNQQQRNSLEAQLVRAYDTAISSAYLTRRETYHHLDTLRKKIGEMVVKVAQEEGYTIVLDSSAGIRSIPLDSKNPFVPKFPDQGNWMEVSLFQLFSVWHQGSRPGKNFGIFDPLAGEFQGIIASLGSAMVREFQKYLNVAPSLVQGSGNFTSGNIFLCGHTDLTAKVAKKLFERYRVPIEIQNSYMIFLHDFLSQETPVPVK